MSSLPDYQNVEQALQLVSSPSGASDTHGMLCALFCGGSVVQSQAWVDSVSMNYVDISSEEWVKAKSILEAFFNATHDCFQEEGVLELLLLNDSAPIANQLEALIHWVQGFLTGLKLLGVNLEGKYSAEVKETLDDLLSISMLGFEGLDDADEELHTAYVELTEYVKVAAMLIEAEREQLGLNLMYLGNATKH